MEVLSILPLRWFLGDSEVIRVHDCLSLRRLSIYDMNVKARALWTVSPLIDLAATGIGGKDCQEILSLRTKLSVQDLLYLESIVCIPTVLLLVPVQVCTCLWSGVA